MSRRVAIVAYSAPPYSAGGVASAHYNLFRAMRHAGVDARLFTFGDYNKADEELITRHGTPSWLARLLRKISSAIFRLLDQRKKAYQTADILSSMLGSWKMGRELSRFAPDAVVLSDHGAPGLMLKKMLGTKWVLVSHHNPGRFIGPPYLDEFSSLDVRLALGLENRVLRRVDAVVCPSRYMKDWFEKSYAYSGPIHVLPNLLDETVMDVKPNLNLYIKIGIARKNPIIYLPSVGSRLKGADFALEIIRRLVENHQGEMGFYIPGVLEPGFEKRLDTLPIGAHIYLARQLPYSQHIANVKACSFGISPSLMENYSMALLEAVWCGVPMLAFRTGGNGEIVSDGNNGFLVDEGDIHQLSLLANRFITGDSSVISKKKVADYSRTNLFPAKTLQKYLDLIDSL